MVLSPYRRTLAHVIALVRIGDSRNASLPAVRNPSVLMSGTQHAKGYARDGRVRLLRVQFDVLSFEAGLPPYPSKLERLRQVVVHEPRNISHRLTAAQREGSLLVYRPARGLGIDPHDAEIAEKPSGQRQAGCPV
jgi:hypothetical protein